MSDNIVKPNKDKIELARGGREASRRSVRDHNLSAYQGALPADGNSNKRYRLADVYAKLKSDTGSRTLQDVKSPKTRSILKKMGLSDSQINKFRRVAEVHAKSIYKKEMAEYKKAISSVNSQSPAKTFSSKPARLTSFQKEEFVSPKNAFSSPKDSETAGGESVLGIKPVNASVAGLNKAKKNDNSKFLGSKKIEPLAKKGSPRGLTGSQGQAGSVGGLNSSYYSPKKGIF